MATTEAALRRAAPDSVDAVRRLPPLVGFSDPLRQENRALEGFLFRALYRHPQVNETTARAKAVLTELFAAYTSAPNEMQSAFADKAAAADLHRVVADYIAGMTDRFAVREHERLTGRRLF